MNIYRKRLKQLRKKMRLLAIDHLLLTNLTNIAYITGFVGTDGVVIVHPRGATLVVDSRYHLQAREQESILRVVKAQGRPFDTALKILQARKGECVAFEAKVVSFAQHQELRRKLKGKKLFGTTNLIEDSRMIKDTHEIAAIRRAVRLSDRVAEEIIADLHPDMRECDVAAEIVYRLMRRGAENVSFDPIVASGPRSALPHARPGTRKLGRRSLIVMDLGAIRNGYCSDLTRTITLGRPTRKQEKIYNIVLDAQQAAKETVRPNVSVASVDGAARKVISDAGYGDCFGHSVGHGVGMAVHELPSVSTGNARILQPGMVITIEPGIYIPGWGGVRIEDVVLVTKSGYETLTKAPKILAPCEG